MVAMSVGCHATHKGVGSTGTMRYHEVPHCRLNARSTGSRSRAGVTSAFFQPVFFSRFGVVYVVGNVVGVWVLVVLIARRSTAQFALKRIEVGVRRVVLKPPGYLRLLALASLARPYGSTPSHRIGVTASVPRNR